MSLILRLLASSFAGIILTMLFCISALACSCAEERTVDKEFASAKQVAILKAVSHATSQNAALNPDDKVGGFTFIVQKTFKGSKLRPGQQLNVFSLGMCDFYFKAGDINQEFLFYYFSDDHFDMVPTCSRSGALRWRAADVLYLEKINDVRGHTRLSGTITQTFRAAAEGDSGRNVSVAGLTVRVTGGGRDIRVATDEDGVYEVYGLLPGSYRIEPEKVDGYIATDEINRITRATVVKVPTKSHAEKNFYLSIHNAIRGKLVDSDGRPLAGVKLSLVPAHGKPAKYFVETDYTERDGSFEFARIPAGTYVIVGNLDNVLTAENPYPRFYSTQEITIGPGQFLDGFKVPATKPAITVIISGRLLFEDGTHVTNGTVRFVTGTGESRFPTDASAYSDKQGNFRLKVLKGQTGLIYGYVSLNTWVFRECLDRVKIIQERTQQEKKDFLETPRTKVESADETPGVELRFPFTLCSGK